MTLVEFIEGYWSSAELVTNGVILLNLLGALVLGMLVGYERSYHGRAAGMRTYGIVCMAAAALTVVAGYPDQWYGGHSGVISNADPTRVIQGIVTGVGFLGAGVIMREGFNISGLTTAASIWASSVIGILVGVGFYAAAMGLSLLSALVMIYLTKVEAWLPSRHAIAITLRFREGYLPVEEALRRMAMERGYEIAGGSLMIAQDHGRMEWRFVALALGKRSGAPMAQLAAEMARFEGVEGFQITHARN